MANDRYPGFPGFRMYQEFFADLGGAFEPIICSDKDVKRLLREICGLVGHPSHEFRLLREDLELTAKIREARRYDADRLFVRFEFRRMEPNCTWSRPLQLMALFDAQLQLVSYTVLRDRDAVGEGLKYRITHEKYNWDSPETTDDPIAALTVLDSEDEPEVMVCDSEMREGLLYVYGGMGPRKCLFDIEWYLGCEPWIFTARNIGFDVVESVFDAVKDGGVRGLSKALDWQMFGFDENHREHGYLFYIDAELKRLLLLAERDGNPFVAQTIRAVGIGDDPSEDAYRIRVKPGTERQMQAGLFNETLEDGMPVGEMNKLLAYLAIRGHVSSMNNLGYQFHFGKGVAEDYDLAEYWHLKGAEKGNAYCMLSLGKIYSEKKGPKWNGPLAIKWFEKAVAHGDDWAKGELGHCLLCGECAGHDYARAEALLSEAVEACPDREDFAADLERVRSGEEL